MELEELKALTDVKFINIVNIYVFDNHEMLISLWFGSDYLRENDSSFLTLLFDYRNCSILKKKTSSHIEKMDKQSIDKRHCFYFNEHGEYFIYSLNTKSIISTQYKLLLDSRISAVDICDGINNEAVFYSTSDKSNTKDIWDDRNVLVLYDWMKKEIIKELTLPEYFHGYLRGNIVDINLSKTKKYLLFGSFPYGFWIYNVENGVVFELFNTRYNWNWGFGFTQIYYCDWSWEGNKVLLNIVSNKESHSYLEGLYEIDLDRIDELNLKIIK